MTFAASAHPDDREAAAAALGGGLQRREEFRYEYRLRHAASGGYRWVLEVGTPRFSGGEFVGYVGTATDIHERRAMEEALRESEASFRDLADTAPAMMWTTDDDGLITFVNEGWLRFTGTTLPGGDGRELGSSACTPTTPSAMLATWDEALAERRAVGGRVPPAPPLGRVPLDRRPRRAALRGRPLRGLRGHRDRHPRAQDDGGRACSRSTSASTGSPRRSSAACCPSACRRSRACELAARYLPGARGAAIGGDWYDVLERPDGRVALVVGDVVGHGLRAAASMGQLRNAFRAYGLVESSPAEVVARINRLVMSGVEEVMATVLYLVLDRETGEVAFSAAGHPPPLVLAPDGPRFLEGGRSVPIGAADPAVFREATAVIPRRLHAAALHRRPRGAPRRAARRAPRPARRGGRARPADDLDALCERVIAAVLGDARPGRRRGAPRRAAAAGRVRADQPDAARPSRARSRSCGGGSPASCTPPAPRSSSSTRSRSRSARRPATRSSTPTGRATRPTRSRSASTAGELTATVRDSGTWRDKRGEHRGRGLSIIEGLMDEVARGARTTAAPSSRMRRRLRDGPGGVSSPAEIVLERRGGSVVAPLSGEIDMTNAALRARPAARLDAERRARARDRHQRLPLPRLGRNRGALRAVAAARHGAARSCGS